MLPDATLGIQIFLIFIVCVPIFTHFLIAAFQPAYLLDAVGSSRILIGKQKITFNSDKLGGNDFTKFSKLTMCSA